MDFVRLNHLKHQARELVNEMAQLAAVFKSGSSPNNVLGRVLTAKREAIILANKINEELAQLKFTAHSLQPNGSFTEQHIAYCRDQLAQEAASPTGASSLIGNLVSCSEHVEDAQQAYFLNLCNTTSTSSSVFNASAANEAPPQVAPSFSQPISAQPLVASLVASLAGLSIAPSADGVPTFDGKAANFDSFWSLYEPIHSDPSISEPKKMNLLFSKLGEQIRPIFRAYTTCAANYDLLVRELKAKYADPSAAIRELTRQLIDLPVHTRGDDLGTFRTLQSVVNQLAYFKTDIENPATFELVSQRLPDRLFRVVLEKATPKTTKAYMDAAAAAFHAFEEYEQEYGRPIVQPPPPPPTHHEQRPARERCLFCGKHGGGLDCRSVSDTETRKHILTVTRRCSRCLSADHTSRECHAQCNLCGGEHHHFICPTREQPRPPARAQQPQALAAPVAQQQPQLAIQQPQQVARFPAQQALPRRLPQVQPAPPAPAIQQPQPHHVASVTASDPIQKEVLLVTASTFVKNPETSQQSESRVFIDPGSQASFMSRELAGELNIQPFEWSQTTISPFNAPAVTTITPIAKVYLRLADGTWKPITVRIVESLPQELKHCQVTPFGSNFRSSLPFQVTTLREETPGILIGMDQLTSVTDLAITHDPATGHAKVVTSFGDLIAGPITVPPSTTASNEVCISTTTLKDTPFIRREVSSWDPYIVTTIASRGDIARGKDLVTAAGITIDSTPRPPEDATPPPKKLDPMELQKMSVSAMRHFMFRCGSRTRKARKKPGNQSPPVAGRSPGIGTVVNDPPDAPPVDKAPDIHCLYALDTSGPDINQLDDPGPDRMTATHDGDVIWPSGPRRRPQPSISEASYWFM